MSVKTKTKQMIIVSLFAAIMCIVSPLSVPIGLVPVSLATFIVYLISALLGKKGVLSVLIYVIIGAIGLPVYSYGTGGFERLIGPTGGFIAGYVFCALIVGMFAEKYGEKRIVVSGFVLGTIVLYLFGTAWFIISSGSGIITALSVCIIPFIPADIIKMLAAFIVLKLIKSKVKF